MSEDREKIVGDIEGLARATVTAYVRYINEHRDLDNVKVLTASAFYLATIVDTLSFGEDDPSQEEVLTLIAETTMIMLKDTSAIRQYMGTILKSVVGEEIH
jgi:hypothetical protein